MFHSRASLGTDLIALGVRAGDLVMLHAGMRAVGPLLNGPDALIDALRDVLGPDGTLMAYTDWDTCHDDLLDADSRVEAQWRDHVPGFDPQRSRATRLNGIIAEFVRTTPSALRSANPGASVAALGAQAAWLTADHPQDYGYGPGSPLAKLVEAGGRVLMIGAPRDTMTLVHHADHLAQMPGKRILRYEVPFATPHCTAWRMVEEFDTSEPIIPSLPENYIEQIVDAFLASGEGIEGKVGDATALLVEAPALCAFAVTWLERHAPR